MSVTLTECMHGSTERGCGSNLKESGRTIQHIPIDYGPMRTTYSLLQSQEIQPWLYIILPLRDEGSVVATWL